ncbi:Spy/CpxP family protein refolding chaperone [Anabaena azotica]|uniref:Spy/CpxP family protein refolding chaperone n=1 Tax=Anabaena azotica TaxID=197653 RepID=UPI0039A6EE8A
MNYKRKLSIYAIPAMGLAISILTAGCQLDSPNRTSFPNNSRENGRSYQTSDNDSNYQTSDNDSNYQTSDNDSNSRSSNNGRNYPSSNNGRNSPSYQRDLNQVSEKMSELNLTDTQKAQVKRIREESEAQIFALLSPEQQQQVQSANNGRYKLSMKKLRSLNLSTEQRQEIREITQQQRQQIQRILTPEQREIMNQWRRNRRDSSSY